MKKFLTILLVGIMILSLSACGEKGEQFDWNDMELSSILPAPKSNIGQIFTNTEDNLSIYIHETSKEEYKNYLAECQSTGFTVESDKSENIYTAYNDAGYKLSLWYMESGKELHIDLDAPIKMQTLQWPTSEIAKLLPIPKSTLGKIRSESSKQLYIYVGETSLDDYNAYVNACSEKGFSMNYDKGDTHYSADNADGYHISIQYQGNNVMSIEISISNEKSTPENENTPPASSIEPTTSNEKTNLVNGMRPEFKEAMESYEAFYDEYCAFMKKYKKNPSDLTLLSQYADMVSKLAEMDEKFEAWNENEMNDAELKYYLEVSNRITQKLLEVAQ